MRRLFSSVLAILITAVAVPLPSAAVTAKPVFPTGLRVGLEPPAGLTPSHRFPGFEDASRHVAVAIFEFPVAGYDKLIRSATSDQQHDMTAVTKGPFPLATGSGYLVGGTAQTDGKPVHRWFLIAKPPDNTAQKANDIATLIRVDVPQEAQAIYTDSVVRKMLASVSFRPTPIKELLALLPFELKNLAGMRVIKVMPGGAMLIDGAGSDLDNQPYAIVAVGRGGPASADLRPRFASDLLHAAPVNDLTITSSERMRISGMPGIEIRAKGKSLRGNAITLVQWLRFGTNGFLRVVGVAPQADWDKMFNRFRALRDGVEFR
jgi:hypothetical protein